MSQKALYIESSPNGPFVVRSRTIPKPGPGEVLVKIQAAALNPVDWIAPALNIIVQEWPAILGEDGAGTVEEVGEGVAGFGKGDRVIFAGGYDSGNDHSYFQQFALASVAMTAKLPPSISFDEGASISLCLATAVVGLYADRVEAGSKKLTPPWEVNGKGLYTGQPIVIFGGSSSVGQYTIQLAKLSGFSPIIATASLRHESFLKSLGATHVIDRNADPVSEVKKIVGTTPVEVVYNISAIQTQLDESWEIVAPGGTLIIASPSPPPADLREKHKGKHIATVFADFRLPEHKALGDSLYSRLTELLQDGSIKPNRVEILPNGLSGIQDGLQRLQKNEVSGVKLVARPQETA